MVTKTNNRMIDGAPIGVSDFSNGSVASDSEFRAALDAAANQNKPLNVDMPVELTGPVTIPGSVRFNKECPIKLITNIGTDNFIRVGTNANYIGYLLVDVTEVTCNHPLWFDGSLEYSSDAAPYIQAVELQGRSHTETTGGLGYVSQTKGATGRSFVQYTHIDVAYIRRCRYGVYMFSDDTAFGSVWVNANTIVNLKAATCRNYLWIEDTGNTEITGNNILNYTFQYGAAFGSHPSQAIKITGNASGNTVLGFTFDWQFALSDDLPVVDLGENTRNNFIKHSNLNVRIRDLGYRNSVVTTSDNSQFNVWLSQFESNYLGNQDNILAHFAGQTGQVNITTETSGAGAISASGDTSNLFKENTDLILLNFTVPDSSVDFARYVVELVPLSERPMSMNGVYIKFEEGFLPDNLRVEIDSGDGTYVAAADVDHLENSDAFLRFDAVFDNADLISSVRRLRVFIQCLSTKQVRVRQICANGNYPTTYTSRGGDRMVGDLLFEDTANGVVLVSSGGNQFRLKVSNTGELSTESVGGANPGLDLTWL